MSARATGVGAGPLGRVASRRWLLWTWVSCLVATASLFVPRAVTAESPADSLLAVVSLSRALAAPYLEGCLGCMVGPDQLLVALRGDQVAALEPGLLAGEKGAALLGAKPAEPLWVSPGVIPEDAATQAGVRVIYRSATNTLFAASRDKAYGLIGKGYFVVEVELRPLSQLSQPHFGRGLIETLLKDRPLTESRRSFMRVLAESVSAANMSSTIYFLDYDEALAKYRSRFAPRHEVRQQVTPHIGDMLASYLVPNGGTVSYQEFKPVLESLYRSDDSIFVNVIGTKPGRKTSAHYIICAHYDAFCGRTPGWDWLHDPAPGADDNASGVAGVLECARILSGLDLDFGVTFIAFSGEELSLLGSHFYVSSLTPQDSVLGVINMDMIGYSAGDPRISLVYDWRSKWLTDQLAELAHGLGISTPVDKVDLSGIADSDHASFWNVGIPANMLCEKLDQNLIPINPHYHTLGDTLGTLDINLACDFVRLVAGYISRFAGLPQDSLPDLVLEESSVEWNWFGRDYLPFVAGDSLRAVVRAMNLGGSMKQPTLYGFQIWQGDRATGRSIYEGTTMLQVLAGEYAEASYAWQTSPGTFGSVPYTFSLRPIASGVESDVTNNDVMVPLYVMAPALVVKDFHIYPNPVTDPANAKLAFEILLPDNDFAGEMQVTLFDVEGRKLAERVLRRSHIGDKDIVLGRNVVDLKEILPAGGDLAPGLYVCLAELKLTGGSGSATAKSKFAVAR